MRGKTRSISEGKNAFCKHKARMDGVSAGTLHNKEIPSRRPFNPVLQGRAGHTANVQCSEGRDTDDKDRAFPGALYGNTKKEKYPHETQVIGLAPYPARFYTH